MRILLINPPFEDGTIFMKEVGRCGRKSIAGELWPQTGLAYLASVIRDKGHEARIEDCMATGMNVEQLLELTREYAPDLILANVTTPTYQNDARILQKLKDTANCIVTMVGTHSSAMPREVLNETCADFVMVNEAELTLGEVLDALAQSADRSKMSADFKRINGLVFQKNGHVVETPKRDHLKQLDELPLPALELLPYKSYRMPFFGDEPFLNIIPTRGCPWPCTFCRAGGVWGRTIRTRSPEHIMNEIEKIVANLGVTNLVFMTDSLTLNRRWASRFFKAIVDSGLKFKWICNSRVDVVDPEMLALMKQSGCQLISYGIESGVQEIIDRCKKGITLEQVRNAVRWTREAGILSMGYFILGLPGETKETIDETIRFAKEIDPDYVNFHVATPFPGTELYNEAVENGWIVSQEWKDFEEEGSAVMRTEHLSPDDLKAAQKRAMREFYIRPRRLMKELASIRNFGQLKTRLRAGRKMMETVFASS